MQYPTDVPLDNKQDPHLQPAVEHVIVQRGSFCPHCGEGRLEYNGLLELECDHCGYSQVEGAGCS